MANDKLSANYQLNLIVDQALAALRQFRVAYTEATQAGGSASPLPLTGALDQAEAAAEDAKRAVDALNQAAAKPGAAELPLTDALQQAETQAQTTRKAVESVNAAGADASRAGARAQAGAKAVSDETARSLRATQNQLRMLGPQLTDIAVGLSTGQSPFYVLLQQGGQLRDIFGGFGPAFRAIGSVLTPVRVAVGGVAAALGGLALAAFQGYRESSLLNKTLALQGPIAGATAGYIRQLGGEIAKLSNSRIGEAREALQAGLGTGVFDVNSLKSAGVAATNLAKLTGEAASQIVLDFAKMGDGVADWAVKANKSYNFLSVEQYKYIRSLESQGRQQEAIRVTLDALNSAIVQRSVPAIGWIEKGWIKAGNALSGFRDLLLSLGREETAEERMASLQERIAKLEAARARADSEGRRRVDRFLAPLRAAEQQMNLDAKRRQELAIEARDEQDRIVRESREFHAAMAQADQAGAELLLQRRLAAISGREAALEGEHARGLIAEREYNLKRNELDQERLRAQRDKLQREIEIEAKLPTKNPLEVEAQRSRLTQLQAQLVGVQAQIKSTEAAGQAIADAASLESARENTQEWARLWQQAFDQIRALQGENASAAAARVTDPVQQARAQAETQVTELRRQLADLQRDLKLRIDMTLDESAKAELVRQLQQLGTEGDAAIAERLRTGQLDALRARFGLITSALATAEAEIAQQVERGAVSTEEAERRKFAARDKVLPQLQAIVAAMRALTQTEGDRVALDELSLALAQLGERTTEVARDLRNQLGQSITGFLNDATGGAKSLGQALQDAVGGFARVLQELINRRLGEQLLESIWPKGSGGGGGWLSAIGNWITSAFVFHTGGVVGSTGAARQLPMGLFAGAPRYHRGGIAGFAPDELPAVLRRGEEVLTADDPRHVRNLRSGMPGGVSISVQVNGAQGDPTQLNAAGNDLARMINAAIEDWAATQSRQGGILANRSTR